MVRKILVKIYGPVSNHCLNAGNWIFYMKSHWKHLFIGHRRGWCQWRQQRGALVFFCDFEYLARFIFNKSAASQKERAGIDFVELAMSLTGSSRLSAGYVYKNYKQLFLKTNCFRE